VISEPVDIWSARSYLSSNEAVVAAEIGEQAVLLHVDTGVYFGLDEVGARIWALLVDGHSLQSILTTLLGEYDVEPERLKADVSRFVKRLCDLKLLQESSR